MRTIGIKCSKAGFEWIVIDGACRAEAQEASRHAASAQGTDRGEQLLWVHQEIREIVEAQQPTLAALRIADTPRSVNNWTSKIARAEIEGVIRETFAEQHVPCSTFSSPSVRSAFSARNKAALEAALADLPVAKQAPKSIYDQLAVAVALLPAESH